MKERLENIINHFGKKEQLNKAVEECSELIQAICKYNSNQTTLNEISVVEEMVDVQIMLKQLRIILDVSDEQLAKLAENKIKRTETKIIENGKSRTIDHKQLYEIEK